MARHTNGHGVQADPQARLREALHALRAAEALARQHDDSLPFGSFSVMIIHLLPAGNVLIYPSAAGSLLRGAC
jgi:hypothetical protein